MREEIASIILGEIDQLIQRLEKVEMQLNQELPKTLEKVSHNILEQQLLLKVRFELQQLSKDLAEQYSEEIIQAFETRLQKQYQQIENWEQQLSTCISLSKQNYKYLAILAGASGFAGALFVCLFFILFKMF